MNSGFTDMHGHFVYGVDDGAQTRSDMEAMIDAAFADGLSRMYGTSHVTPGLRPFNFELYSLHLEEGRQYCARKNYPLSLFSGAELLYTPAMRPYLQRGLPTLGKTDFILVEFVPDISSAEMERAFAELSDSPYTPIIAHIERYPSLFSNHNARRFKERYPLYYQVNCRTAIHGLPGLVRNHTLKSWFKEGLVDFIASDAHNTGDRPTMMSAAYKALSETWGEEMALRLCSNPELA